MIISVSKVIEKTEALQIALGYKLAQLSWKITWMLLKNENWGHWKWLNRSAQHSLPPPQGTITLTGVHLHFEVSGYGRTQKNQERNWNLLAQSCKQPDTYKEPLFWKRMSYYFVANFQTATTRSPLEKSEFGLL